MFKRYLVVMGALVVPILLAVASQVLSAPVPPATLSPEPVSLTVTGTAAPTEPVAVATAREVLQAPQVGVPSGHVPAPTSSADSASSLTSWTPAGTAVDTAPAGTASSLTEDDQASDTADDADQGVDSDER